MKLLDNVEKDLVITHVTNVRQGKYGYRVTINAYENKYPDTITDTLYMITLGVNNEILQNMINQLDINEDVSSKLMGDKIKIPTGLYIKVKCGQIVDDTYRNGVKHMNKVNEIKILGEVTEEIDRVFSAREVEFKDWGIVMKNMDGDYVGDRFAFFMTHLPEKVSSLMDRYKVVTPADQVHIKGTARVYYATYPKDNTLKEWIVKPKFRFDTRFDDPSAFEIDMDLKGIQTMYVSKINKMKGNPAFKNLVKVMAQSWEKEFACERVMVEEGNKIKIDFDPNLIPSIFLSSEERERFYYLKSMVSDDHDIYFHSKGDGFKYVVFHDTGTNDIKMKLKGKEPKFYKIIVYDVKLGFVYLFKSKKIPINLFLKKIEENEDEFFLERIADKNANYKFVEKIKISPENGEWIENVADFMYEYR